MHGWLDASQRLDPLHRRRKALNRGDARHPLDDRGGSDLVAIDPWSDAVGRVHNEVNLARHDRVDRRGFSGRTAPLVLFAQNIGPDPISLESLSRARGV